MYPAKVRGPISIEVPDTKQISGPWGSIKVRGTIDGCDFGVMNLMPLRDKNAIMSINAKIRKSIGKSGGDAVVVTMWLLDAKSIFWVMTFWLSITGEMLASLQRLD